MATAFQTLTDTELALTTGGSKVGHVLGRGGEYLVKGGEAGLMGGLIAGGTVGYPLGRWAQVPLAMTGGALGAVVGMPVGLAYGLGKGIYEAARGQ